MATPLPPADPYAIISRRSRRPFADVISWTLNQPLPEIPIPLKGKAPDAWVELQPVFDGIDDRARHDLMLNDSAAVDPPFSEDERAGVDACLARRAP